MALKHTSVRVFGWVSLCTLFVSAMSFFVVAAPDSTFVKKGANNAPATNQTGTLVADWPSPVFGQIIGTSGETWVEGNGSMSDNNDTYQNDWVTTYADTRWEGDMTDVDEYKWELSLDYPGYVEAKTTYVGLGGPYQENFRAETTGTVEIRGDFGPIFGEYQVVVDSYTTPTPPDGESYDAVGGGSPPASYPGAGVSSVMSATTSPITTKNFAEYPGPTGSKWQLTKKKVELFLYARGKQYMHNDEEERVSLFTKITAENSDGTKGFKGWVKSWHKVSGKWEVLKTHPIN